MTLGQNDRRGHDTDLMRPPATDGPPRSPAQDATSGSLRLPGPHRLLLAGGLHGDGEARHRRVDPGTSVRMSFGCATRTRTLQALGRDVADGGRRRPLSVLLCDALKAQIQT